MNIAPAQWPRRLRSQEWYGGTSRDLAQKVKAGVWEAGGFPLEVPVFSASENTYGPTAMSRSSGTCNTMGAASSMASMTEALCMALSGNKDSY